MKKLLKKLFIVLLVALVVIQFFRPAKNKGTVTGTNDISSLYPVSAEVKDILQTSCNDCHSNSTVYPWYAEVQPVAWWLNNHITNGKRHLNFSEFASYRPGRQFHKLEEIEEMVKEDEMPLKSYTLIHRKAILDDTKKQVLYNWVKSLQDSLKAHYPPDSLVQKK